MKRAAAAWLSTLFVVCLLSASAVVCDEPQERAKNDKQEVAATREKPAKKKPSLAKKLSRRISVDTEGETLTSLVEKLSDETDVNMVIDYSVFQNRQEIRLGKTKLKDIPLGSALKAILRSVGLDYKAYEHFVFISTAGRFRQYSVEKLETRFYELDSAGAESLPKVALINPAAIGQGGRFGSITQLMIPVNPALVGGAAPSAQPR